MWGVFKRFENKSKNKHKVQIKLWKVQMRTTDLASYSLTQWQFWQLNLKWLSGACAQDKNKQFYCCFLFFLIFIQLCDSRKIDYLTGEFRVKLHLKTNIARIAISVFACNLTRNSRVRYYEFSHKITQCNRLHKQTVWAPHGLI